jgi:hypothetical protein
MTKESDWKLLRELKPILLERLCERILGECRETIAEEGKSAHERYLALYDLVRNRDRDVAACFDDHRRSTVIMKSAAIHGRGLLEPEELARFSAGTQETVRALCTPLGESP